MKNFTLFTAILMLVAVLAAGCSDETVAPQAKVQEDPIEEFEWDEEVNEQVVGLWIIASVTADGIPSDVTQVIDMVDTATDIAFAVSSNGAYTYREYFKRRENNYVQLLEILGSARTGKNRFEFLADEKSLVGTWERQGDLLTLHVEIDNVKVDLIARDLLAN